jgi:heme/copper-type cytochrome/quinol oxidase subunit 2
MNKNILIPIALFFLSMILTIMFNPIALLVVGLAICVVAVLKYRAEQVLKSKLGANSLFRSGLAVIAGAIVAVVFVFAAMSGLLSK